MMLKKIKFSASKHVIFTFNIKLIFLKIFFIDNKDWKDIKIYKSESYCFNPLDKTNILYQIKLLKLINIK